LALWLPFLLRFDACVVQGGAFWVTDASAPSGVTIERSQLANNRATFTGGGSVRCPSLSLLVWD
jgi:hypothetical protein